MIKQDVKSRVLREFLATLQNPLAPFAKKELYDFFEFHRINRNIARKFICSLIKQGAAKQLGEGKVILEEYFYFYLFCHYDYNNSLSVRDFPYCSKFTNDREYETLYCQLIDTFDSIRNYQASVEGVLIEMVSDRRSSEALSKVSERGKECKKEIKKLFKLLKKEENFSKV